jgi:hypothetical protein
MRGGDEGEGERDGGVEAFEMCGVSREGRGVAAGVGWEDVMPLELLPLE